MMGVQRSSPVLPQREMASSYVSVDEEPSPTEWLFLWRLPRKGQGRRAQIFELLSEFGDVKKAKKISEKFNLNRIAISGGVASNYRFRKILKDSLNRNRAEFYFPDSKLCTDNASMIAFLGYKKYNKLQYVDTDFTPYTNFN